MRISGPAPLEVDGPGQARYSVFAIRNSRLPNSTTMSQPVLRPQDAVILAKLLTYGGRRPPLAHVAADLSISASEVHAGLKRLACSAGGHSRPPRSRGRRGVLRPRSEVHIPRKTRRGHPWIAYVVRGAAARSSNHQRLGATACLALPGGRPPRTHARTVVQNRSRRRTQGLELVRAAGPSGRGARRPRA